MLVYCTEQHHIKRSKPVYKVIDQLAIQAKNLYNKAIYEERQFYFETGKYIPYFTLYDLLKTTEAYKSLPCTLAQSVLKHVAETFYSFIKASISYAKTPEKFNGKPRLPGYKDKDTGRCGLTFNKAKHGCRLKGSVIHFHCCLKGFTLKTKLTDIVEVRIAPRNGIYIAYVTGLKEIDEQNNQNLKYVAGIDIGIDNFSAITVWNNTTRPLIINGKGLKSYNKYFNRRLAKLKSEAKSRHDLYMTKRMKRLIQKRNNYMHTWMHQASTFTANYLLQNHVKYLVIGYNKGWKKSSPLSKKVNQTFVQIPHKKCIDCVIYKAQAAGIKVYLAEESYTSGTSFLDNEQPKKEYYDKSRRKHRGLFQSNENVLINADVNASYQICKKAFPGLCIEHGVLTKEQLHNKTEPIRLNVS